MFAALRAGCAERGAKEHLPGLARHPAGRQQNHMVRGIRRVVAEILFRQHQHFRKAPEPETHPVAQQHARLEGIGIGDGRREQHDADRCDRHRRGRRISGGVRPRAHGPEHRSDRGDGQQRSGKRDPSPAEQGTGLRPRYRRRNRRRRCRFEGHERWRSDVGRARFIRIRFIRIRFRHDPGPGLEHVAKTGDGAQAVLAFFTERAAQQPDALGEAAVLDHQPGPDASEQRFAGMHDARFRKEQQEQVEDPRRKFGDAAVDFHPSLPQIDAQITDPQRGRCRVPGLAHRTPLAASDDRAAIMPDAVDGW